MENSNIVFIGMDTHKESTDVSYALDGHNNAPQHLGKFPSRKLAMQKLVRQLQSKFSGPHFTFVTKRDPAATGYTACYPQ